jgi:hypothetical protein
MAARPAQVSAVVPAPKRRASAGIRGADAIMPSGVMAADKPISADDVPWRSRMKLSSG